MSLLSAPRTLKARIGWIDSIFRCTWQRALSVKAREYCSGVGGRELRRPMAARSTSSAVTFTVSGSICFTTATLPSARGRGFGPRIAERKRAREGTRQEGQGTEDGRGQSGIEEARSAPGGKKKEAIFGELKGRR